MQDQHAGELEDSPNDSGSTASNTGSNELRTDGSGVDEHRLAGAKPEHVPADADRDEDGEAVFDASLGEVMADAADRAGLNDGGDA